jgi:carboxyl-terminal processing protease
MLRAAHKKRLLVDPDLIYLNEELNLIKKRGSLKEVSLNEAERRLQLEEYDSSMLALENKRRAAKYQSEYDTIEEWQSAVEAKKESIKADKNVISTENDPILHEAGNIFSDYINHVFSSLSSYGHESNLMSP